MIEVKKSMKKKKKQKHRKIYQEGKRDSKAFGVSKMYRRYVNRCERKQRQFSRGRQGGERKVAFVEVMPFRGFRFSLHPN